MNSIQVKRIGHGYWAVAFRVAGRWFTAAVTDNWRDAMDFAARGGRW